MNRKEHKERKGHGALIALVFVIFALLVVKDSYG